MKDEKEKMQEYLKQYTNANSEIPKPKAVKNVVRILKVIIFIISSIVASIWIIAFITYAWPRISIFFT